MGPLLSVKRDGRGSAGRCGSEDYYRNYGLSKSMGIIIMLCSQLVGGHQKLDICGDVPQVVEQGG